MKSKLIILLIILSVMTGCGNTKKLECSAKVSELNLAVTVEYNGDEIKTVKRVMSYDASALTSAGVDEQNREIFISSMKSEVCAAYSAYNGIKCEVSTPNNGLNITVDIDYSKLEQGAKDSLDLNYQSYDTLKENLIEQGYTCK